jgi:eukaryotic-like serine/threonine-protein kinase
MSQNAPLASRPAPTIDCPRCGRSVPRVDLITECPHCGVEMRVPRSVPLDETMLLSAGASAERSDTIVDTSGAEADSLVGADIGTYHIDSLLGRGGMGRVYLAHHHGLHRQCALKILNPELAGEDRDYIERFQNEGRAAAALVHPNVVTIHAIGRHDDWHFLEMEYVPGRSLRQLIQDEQRLAPLRATALAARIADGLAEAHRVHIVHRDLKPDNVMLTLQGVPKLADFGLCKRVRGASGAGPQGLCGTPHFMAPELFHGAEATPASDVYALGVSYFLMLTGMFPFHGESLPLLAQAVTGEPLPNIRRLIPDLPLEMAECLHLMLDRSPANRPPDAIKAAQLLQAVLGHAVDLETLMAAAFRDDANAAWSRVGERFLVTVQLPAERRQRVYVEQSAHAAAERLLMIYSTCCDARPEFYAEALRLNADIPHGSVAIRTVDGQEKFVVVDTYPRATVDDEEIRRSVHEVAVRADAIEKLLTGIDHE